MIITGSYSWYKVFNVVLTISGCIGLYCYCFSKKLFHWKFWIAISVAAPLVYVSRVSYHFLSRNFHEALNSNFSGNYWLMIAAMGMSILLKLPYYIGLILYSLPSYPLWSRSKKN